MNAEVLVPLFVLFLVSMPLLVIGLTVIIDDWSRTRKNRKKAAAKAKAKSAVDAAAADGIQSAAKSA